MIRYDRGPDPVVELAPIVDEQVVVRARHRLTRALRHDRVHGDRLNTLGHRLLRYVAHLAYVDLRAVGLAHEADLIVAREARR